MSDRVKELMVGLFVEERMFADALTAWFLRRAPAAIRVSATESGLGRARTPAIAIADEHLLDQAGVSRLEGALGTVVILDPDTPGPRNLRAAGYVAMTDIPEMLVDAIQAVSSGTSFVSAEASRVLSVETPAMPVHLTEKQRRLLALYVDGLSLQQAAAVIGIGFGTAGGYLKLIRKKFRAAGIAATTKIELGLALRAYDARAGSRPRRSDRFHRHQRDRSAGRASATEEA